MTLSNSFLVVLECFWKWANHKSTGRSVSRWVMLHVSENGFSINGGSWSRALILRLTNTCVHYTLANQCKRWAIFNILSEWSHLRHCPEVGGRPCLQNTDGLFQNSQSQLQVTHFSFLPPQCLLSFPPSSCRQRRISCPNHEQLPLWGCSRAPRTLRLALLTGAHCRNRNRNHSWLLLTGQMKNY